jgi:hypothetical protein
LFDRVIADAARKREAKLASDRAWREAHPDYDRAYREKNREAQRACDRKWREAHPDYDRERYLRRKARAQGEAAADRDAQKSS